MSFRQTRHHAAAPVFFLIMIVLGLHGCSSDEAAAPRSAEVLFESAMQKFQDEDYQEAYEEFRLVTLQYQGSTLADDAQFHMGECKFRRGEYILAAYEYEVLMQTMPTSEFVPNARFHRAMCFYEMSPKSYLDQENSRKAIDEFQAFLEYHPTDARVPEAEAKISELNAKLAQKEFENGVIYMKMEYYRAAVVSFDFVLEKYHDTEYAEPALLRKGEALLLRKRFPEAVQVLQVFLEKYPSSPLRAEAEGLVREAAEKDKENARTIRAKAAADSARSSTSR
ncbi:MAG: outer membrane protein assembly factor BamD [Ignavibacteriales bacterium]|nr:outer membrane protein assembly factor BamD [Ignavibacteriales bacterium]